MSETIIVIPCYDEAGRLPVQVLSEYVRKCEDVDFILVNDGSRDTTLDVMRELASSAPERFTVLDQQPNQGKAEAVRVGINAAFERGARFVGYFDADLATPLDEISRLAAVLDANERIEMVFGARVQLMGHRIERHSWRHYLGRIFATFASESLSLPIYDTQCGAKLFRAGPATRQLFAEPFLAGWFFDVEIVARRVALSRSRDLHPAAEVIYELPLMQWVDVPGSKLRASDFVRALFEILRVHRRYLSRRAPPFGTG